MFKKLLTRFANGRADQVIHEPEIKQTDLHAMLEGQGFQRDKVREDAMWQALCPMGPIPGLVNTPHIQYFINNGPQGAQVAAINLKPDCRLTGSCRINFSKLGQSDLPTQPPRAVDRSVTAAHFMRSAASAKCA